MGSGEGKKFVSSNLPPAISCFASLVARSAPPSDMRLKQEKKNEQSLLDKHLSKNK
jgi:hypothetical protein